MSKFDDAVANQVATKMLADAIRHFEQDFPGYEVTAVDVNRCDAQSFDDAGIRPTILGFVDVTLRNTRSKE